MQNAQRKTSTLTLFTEPVAPRRTSVFQVDKQANSGRGGTLTNHEETPVLLAKEQICSDMATD